MLNNSNKESAVHARVNNKLILIRKVKNWVCRKLRLFDSEHVNRQNKQKSLN